MKTINVTLSPEGIKAAKKELAKYKRELNAKCKTFVKELSKLGITTAREHLRKRYKPYITFATEVDPVQNGYRALMVATNTGLIHSQWRTGPNEGDVASADVSPLLMAEFGAGIEHDHNPRAHEFGMGAGTFPGQTHAMDPGGWWYMNLEGEWIHSTGIEPTMPMTEASKAIVQNVNRIAKEVFGK